MSLDLEFDATQLAVADALRGFARDHCESDPQAAPDAFPDTLWQSLAELGVLGLATPEGEGGVLELAAAMEALGESLCPGPLCAAFFAAQLVPPDLRSRLAAGEAIPAVGTPPLLPWGAAANLFVGLDAEGAFLGSPDGSVEPVATLGAEPWGRVRLRSEQRLEGLPRALAVEAVARAAYLSAAGQRLIGEAAEHARTRRQFGRAIAEFQAVSHPLARCRIRLDAAGTLARGAAWLLDQGREAAAMHAAAARLSAAGAALDAAHTAHQVFGALGITLEGPVFRFTRRIRQLVSQPPDAASARMLLLGLARGREATSDAP